MSVKKGSLYKVDVDTKIKKPLTFYIVTDRPERIIDEINVVVFETEYQLNNYYRPDMINGYTIKKIHDPIIISEYYLNKLI